LERSAGSAATPLDVEVKIFLSLQQITHRVRVLTEEVESASSPRLIDEVSLTECGSRSATVVQVSYGFVLASDFAPVPLVGSLSAHPECLSNLIPRSTSFSSVTHDVPATTGHPLYQAFVRSECIQCADFW
jgi:hypothetical protein